MGGGIREIEMVNERVGEKECRCKDPGMRVLQLWGELKEIL